MPKQPKNLRGKVAVITGAGRGIGAATAAALAALGVKVVIGDLDLTTAEETAKNLRGEAIALPLDVTDAAGFTAFLDEAQRRVGPIDILINNAGIMPLIPVVEESDVMARRSVEVNLLAVIHGTKEAVKRMQPRATGHIVNVASVAGKSGFPGGSTYCATKHAVVGYTEAARRELRGSGIEFSLVMPAIVRTELASGLGEANMIKSVRPEEVAEQIVNALLFPRFEVYVPKSVGPIMHVMSAFPHKFADKLGQLMKAENLLSGAVHSPERAAYESRAAESAPSVKD